MYPSQIAFANCGHKLCKLYLISNKLVCIEGMGSQKGTILPSFLFSLLLTGIFPNTISKVFMAALLAGKDALSADDYICGLLDHVSEYDSLQLKSALETLTTAYVFWEGMSIFLLEFGIWSVSNPNPLLTTRYFGQCHLNGIAKPSVALNDIRAGMFEGKFHKLREISAKQK